MHRKPVRYLIILLTLLLNLAIAQRAQAGLKNSLCRDPESGEMVDCCAWCLFSCDCDFEFVP